MIDFRLSDDQKQFRDLAREFARNEITPRARHHDETGEYPMEICRKAWELGLMNTHVPAAYGGLGLGVLEGCLIAEEVAWGCTGIGTAMEANTLAQCPVIVAGTEEQKLKWLSPLTEEFRLRPTVSPSPAPAATFRASKPRRRVTATTTSSTGARCGSRTGALPTGTSSSPTPIPPRSTGG
jgi:alkylation response protein AidB-like acyl-CoA dehydrogenase